MKITTSIIIAILFLTAKTNGANCSSVISCDGKGNGKWVYTPPSCEGNPSSTQMPDPAPASICKCVPYSQKPKSAKPSKDPNPLPTTYCPEGTPAPTGGSIFVPFDGSY